MIHEGSDHPEKNLDNPLTLFFLPLFAVANVGFDKWGVSTSVLLVSIELGINLL